MRANSSHSAARTRLATYRKKRDFQLTEEPQAGRPTRGGDSFVIQKHAASHLHYDFRLELDGVLLSWAVPKGPSTRAGERRLAMRTEDHPLDYAGFEGIIPQGQYGGGSVIVWDRGRWIPDGDPRAGLKKGHLAFELKGEKLSGRWHLVRTKNERESWLLFKSEDEGSSDRDIVADMPKSVVSGRSVEEIGEKPGRVWLPKDLQLTHPDKVLFEDVGATKETLALYYLSVAEPMLALIANRPLALLRCPDGAGKGCFYQKHAKDLPKSIHRVQVQERGAAKTEHTYIDSKEGLLAMAQLGVLELHTWGCHEDNIERPDQLVFDLDPDIGLPWKKVVDGALEVRGFLEALGLTSFVKTTGGKGLHVVAPIERRIDWEAFKAFAHHVVLAIEASDPERYVTNPLKKVRKGKIFLDYLRNGRGATAVAPYSTRAREGATVSTPLEWDELTPKLDPRKLNILTLPERLHQLGGKLPWRDYDQVKQSITAAAQRKVARGKN